jgi:hypothetical protein
MAKKYIYHVSYGFTAKEGSGIGSCTCTRPKPIRTSGDIEDMRQNMVRDFEFEKLNIINFIRLKG